MNDIYVLDACALVEHRGTVLLCRLKKRRIGETLTQITYVSIEPCAG